MNGPSILFIGAHPDDLEILCGGTICICLQQGFEVWLGIATNGNVGTPDLSREEIAAIRKEEASASAKALGVHGLIWMNEDDELLFDDKPTRLKFVDAIRQAKADIVVAHNPNDYHPDHRVVSRLATDARILSAVRLVETRHPPVKAPPELFYMDSVAGIGFPPDYLVDVTASFERKLSALGYHKSQNAWMRDLFDRDLPELACVQSAFRGLQGGVKYAEAFSQPSYWPKRPFGLPFLEGDGRTKSFGSALPNR